MKSIQTLFTVLCITLLYATAQSQDHFNAYPGQVYTEYRKMAAHGQYLVALGNCDITSYSNDGGQTWNTTNISGLVNDLKFSPASLNRKAYIAASDFHILDLDNNTVETIPGRIRSFSFWGDELIAARGNSIFVIDANSLENIDSLYSFPAEDNDYLTTSTIVDNIFFGGSRRGKIISIDLNTKVVTTARSTDKWIRDIQMIDKNKGYIYAQSSEALYTEDGWATLSQGLYKSTLPFRVINENKIIGHHARYLQIFTDTEPGGESYDYTGNEGALIRTSAVDEAGNFYVAGTGNFLAKLEGNEAELSPFGQSTIQENLLAITVFGSKAFAGGGNSFALWSDDHGQTWSEVDWIPETAEGNTIQDAKLIAENDIIVGAYNGVYRVIDGATTQLTDRSCYQMVVDDNGTNIVIVNNQSGNYEVYSSADGGQNWALTHSQEKFIQELVHGYDGKLYIADGSDYLYSSDWGQSWQRQTTTVENLASVHGIADDAMLLATNRDLYYSTDQGQSTEKLTSGYALSNIMILGPDHYLVTTGQNSKTNLFEHMPGDRFRPLTSYCVETHAMALTEENDLLMANRYGNIHVSEINISTNNQEYIQADSFTAWPNPISAGQTLHVGVAGGNARLYQADGRLAHTAQVESGSIKIPQLKPGLYLLQVLGESTWKSGKILVK